MQTFSALNVRSHQRRQFSSSRFAYRDGHVLKLTSARTFEFQPAPPTQRIRKSLPPSSSSSVATSVTLGSSRRPALKRFNASTTSDSGRLATRCSSAPVCRPVCSALLLTYEAPASPAPPQCRDPQQCSAPQQRSSAPVFCTPVSTPVRDNPVAHRCPVLRHLVAPFFFWHLVAPCIGTSLPRCPAAPEDPAPAHNRPAPLSRAIDF